MCTITADPAIRLLPYSPFPALWWRNIFCLKRWKEIYRRLFVLAFLLWYALPYTATTWFTIYVLPLFIQLKSSAVKNISGRLSWQRFNKNSWYLCSFNNKNKSGRIFINFWFSVISFRWKFKRSSHSKKQGTKKHNYCYKGKFFDLCCRLRRVCWVSDWARKDC